MRRTALALAVIVAGCTAAVAVAAPGGAAGTTPNQRALLQAFQKTAAATGSHFSFVVSSGTFTISGSGGVDTKHQTGKFRIDLGKLAMILGEAAGGVSIPRAFDVVVVKSTAYAHIPSVATQIQTGTEWLRFDAKSLPSSITATNLSKVDPQRALAQLTSSVTVHRVGTATVRGSSTTHYGAVVSATKLVSVLPKSQQAAEAKALKQLNLKTLPLEIYVDGSGYVRRVSTSVPHVILLGSPAGATFKASFDLYDFGTRINVSAPPASKVADGGKLLQQLIPSGMGG